MADLQVDSIANEAGTGGSSIYLGGVAAANLLDDYEEGTFTPVAEGETTAGAGTYSVQSGEYTKIGSSVTATLYCIWTAHTGTGTLRITGLPFTVKPGTYGTCANNADSATVVKPVTGRANQNSTYMTGFLDFDESATSMGATGRILCSFSYLV